MAKKVVYLDVWDAMNKEYVAKSVTIDKACTIIGCKYNTIMNHRKDSRLIMGRYKISESKEPKVKKDIKVFRDEDKAVKEPLLEDRTLGSWAEDWRRICLGASLVKTGMGVIRRGSDGRFYVYSKKYLQRGGQV